ncbi:unnamed protein product [Sordaria macrospora k-hell]|uniref:WGS project CABT00000000 data, contig 2.36 n=1 Tax=Sordaria macrospora (strain ATCC MYA-333 / DSM 997 / K(L3346) / K-hell) TaxID=771870 RepID=F7W6T3_SORMK|nr:uncharacterized protein SMAC_09377 [Sordaria macrospora k-hell]CCC13223.1 unnamed protein product [Sordaria macrospora k-hell]
MPGQSDTPRTPTSTSTKTGKITDFFKSVHQSEPKQVAKRELDVEDHEDSQPSKRLKQSEDGHAGRIGTAHHKVDIDIDTPKRKKPASARLLDDTDGGLADSFVGRRRFTKETNAEDVKPIQDAHLKSTRPLRTADRTNQSGRKRPTSSRLLDETDGGLEESLTSPSEDPEENENQKVDSKDDTVNGSTMGNNAVGNNISDDDSEASTIRAWDSEDEMSSSGDVDGEGDEALDFDIFEDEEEREDDESGNGAMDDKSLRDITDEFDTVEDDSETETIKADNSDDDDDKDGSIDKDDKEDDDGSDKENVRPRVPYKAPSLPLIPSNPKHHGNQEDETADPTENDQPSPSPSSFMLPSPVADLPPVPPPSPTSPSTLPPDFSSTLLSHPS